MALGSSPERSADRRVPLTVEKRLVEEASKFPALQEKAKTESEMVSARLRLAEDLMRDKEISAHFRTPQELSDHLLSVSRMTRAHEGWLAKGWRNTKEFIADLPGKVWRNKGKILLAGALVAGGYLLYQFVNWDDIMRSLHTTTGRLFGDARGIAGGAPSVAASGTVTPLTSTAGSGGVPLATPGGGGGVY